MLYIFQQQVSFCWETQHTALVIVTVREVLKQIISRKSDKHVPSPTSVCVRRCCQSKAVLDGSRMAKHPPAGNGNEAGGVEREEEGRRGRPTCLDPLSPGKGQWFRITASDQLPSQGEVWSKPVSVGMRFGWSKHNLAVMEQAEFPWCTQPASWQEENNSNEGKTQDG